MAGRDVAADSVAVAAFVDKGKPWGNILPGLVGRLIVGRQLLGGFEAQLWRFDLPLPKGFWTSGRKTNG